MSEPERPKRRVRYSGKNPRRVEEKYKEHEAERYAEDVEKVLASGKTPAGMHRPIMVREILGVLAPQPGEIAVDATLGYGGHARELLAAIQPNGKLLGLDVDPLEFPKTEARLRALGFPAETLVVQRMNYAGLVRVLAAESARLVERRRSLRTSGSPRCRSTTRRAASHSSTKAHSICA